MPFAEVLDRTFLTLCEGAHVLRGRYDEVLATLEAVAGWETARVQRPVPILGRLEGVQTGIRQLRRTAPLETEIIQGLRVPTLAEMARIKAWLLRDGVLRARILRVIQRVPLPFPHAWLAALATLGEKVDFAAPLPRERGV